MYIFLYIAYNDDAVRCPFPRFTQFPSYLNCCMLFFLTLSFYRFRGVWNSSATLKRKHVKNCKWCAYGQCSLLIYVYLFISIFVLLLIRLCVSPNRTTKTQDILCSAEFSRFQISCVLCLCVWCSPFGSVKILSSICRFWFFASFTSFWDFCCSFISINVIFGMRCRQITSTAIWISHWARTFVYKISHLLFTLDAFHTNRFEFAQYAHPFRWATDRTTFIHLFMFS